MTQKASESTAEEREQFLLAFALKFAELCLKDRIAVALAVADRFIAKGDLDLARRWVAWALEMERELKAGSMPPPSRRPAESDRGSNCGS